MIIRRIEDAAGTGPVGQAIRSLVSTQLANDQSLDDTLRQIDFATGRTVLIGGFVGDALVTMNAFMPQRFRRSGTEILGYQSGFSATHGDHRGKGYWPKLLTASEAIVRDAGGRFIFGYPNPVSQPLFEKKLHYSTSPMFRTILPLALAGLFPGSRRQATDLFVPDVRGTAEWKKRHDGAVVTAETAHGFAFGKVRASRALRYVDVGGFSHDGSGAAPVLRRLGKEAGARLFRFEWSEPGEFAGGFTPRRPTRPVIFKSLDGALTIDDISFTGGLADNY